MNPIFQRRHHKYIAKILSDGLFKEYTIEPTTLQILIANEFCIYFKLNNPNFSRELFLQTVFNQSDYTMTKQNVCDNCLTAVYDEDGSLNQEEQTQIAITMGNEIIDHICEPDEGYECYCLCHKTT